MINLDNMIQGVLVPVFGDKLSRSKITRSQRVLKEGSPKFHYDVGVLAAGANVAFDIFSQYPLARKYEPLDTMVIINNDNVAISVRVNSDAGDLYIVPAGAIRIVDKGELGAVRWVRITNLDAAIAVTANRIDIDFSKSAASVDELARMDL